jgi:hypothetical protein
LTENIGIISFLYIEIFNFPTLINSTLHFLSIFVIRPLQKFIFLMVGLDRGSHEPPLISASTYHISLKSGLSRMNPSQVSLLCNLNHTLKESEFFTYPVGVYKIIKVFLLKIKEFWL